MPFVLITNSICTLLAQKRFRRREQDQRYQATQQVIEVALYVGTVLDCYARTCVVRIV